MHLPLTCICTPELPPRLAPSLQAPKICSCSEIEKSKLVQRAAGRRDAVGGPGAGDLCCERGGRELASLSARSKTCVSPEKNVLAQFCNNPEHVP